MGIFPFVGCPCPCWPPSSSSTNQPNQHQSHNQYQPIHPRSETDERTPLITNPPQVTPAPHLPIIDTAQQQADEAAANKIVNQTVRCLVDVYSQAPFSHLRIQESLKPAELDLHHTPDGSSSTWRAYDPPICPPVSSQGCRLILGFDQVPPSSEPQYTPKYDDHNQKAAHQRSYHSLKTIVNHNQPQKEDGKIKQDFSSSQINSKSNAAQPPSSSCSQHPHSSSKLASDQLEITPHHSRQNSIAQTSCSTQFNTINSFQTARDDTNSEMDLPDYLNQSIETLSNLDEQRTRLIEKPEFVKNLWNHQYDQSSSGEHNPAHIAELQHAPAIECASLDHSEHDSDFLTDDPTRLTEMISNGFELKDPGPILVEL